MTLYRLVKDFKRAGDLTGRGASMFGGRWNSKGTYMLYTSENSSLAILESLVHFDIFEEVPSLFLVRLKLDEKAPIYTVSKSEYPLNWKEPENIATKRLGDIWMQSANHLAYKVKSVVNENEFNYLLNPLFPGFSSLVKIINKEKLSFDRRLINR